MMIFPAKEASGWSAKQECAALPKDPVKAQMLAGQLFADAEAKYRESAPIEALKGFLCSFQIIQHENTLFNIGQIAKLSSNREEALVLLRDFVANTSGSTKVDPIRELIAELEGQISNDTTGKDTVPNSKDKSQPISPVASEEDGNKLQSAPATKPSSSSDSKSKALKIAGWAVFGVGAAAAVGGGVLQGLAGSAQQQASSAEYYSDFSQAEDRMNIFQTSAIASFAVGGTFLASGLILVLMSKKKSKKEQAVLLLPGTYGLSITGRF
jgi:hypothetical protein